MANKKIKVVEEQAATTTTQVVEDWNFVREITEAITDAYEVGFADCKKKIAQDYLQLDLRIISTVDDAPEKGVEEEAAEEEAIRTKEPIAEGPKAEAAVTKGLEELATAPKI